MHSWWEGLTRDQQDQAIRDFSQLVGWLDGVPAVDRDKANRTYLAAEKQRLLDYIRTHTPAQVAQAANDFKRLTKVEDALNKLGPNGFLLGVDLTSYDGDGKVVIAVGNPDTSHHTGVWVPGLSTTLKGSMDDNVERMVNLHDAADKMTRGQKGDVSTVYWLGYDAPDLNNTSVLNNDRSIAGREPYLQFMEGVRATHEGEPAHLVAMGHSYGSTVVGEAARTGHLDVNDILVVGSPGMHVDNASQLMHDPRHVWAGAALDDPVAEAKGLRKYTVPILGPIGTPIVEHIADSSHGTAPSVEGFGGNRFAVDTSGHSNYWNNNSESLTNQARILVGAYDKTTLYKGGQAPPEIP